MLVAHRFAMRLEDLSKHRFGGRIVAPGCRDQCEIVHGRGRVRVLLTSRLAVHLETLPEQRLGAREITLQSQDRREVAQADRRFSDAPPRVPSA